MITSAPETKMEFVFALKLCALIWWIIVFASSDVIMNCIIGVMVGACIVKALKNKAGNGKKDWSKIEQRVRCYLDRDTDLFRLELLDADGTVIWEKVVSSICVDSMKDVCDDCEFYKHLSYRLHMRNESVPCEFYKHLSDRLHSRMHKCDTKGMDSRTIDVLADKLLDLSYIGSDKPLPPDVVKALFAEIDTVAPKIDTVAPETKKKDWSKIERRVRCYLDRDTDFFRLELLDADGIVIWEKVVSSMKDVPCEFYKHLSDRLHSRMHKCDTKGMDSRTIDVLEDKLFVLSYIGSDKPLPPDVIKALFAGIDKEEALFAGIDTVPLLEW